MKTKLLLLCLSFNSVLFPMEEFIKKKSDFKISIKEETLEECYFPNEILDIILKKAYFDSTIFDKANNIFEAITIVKAYIIYCQKKFDLVCRNFNELTIKRDQWVKFKKEIKNFYIPHLNQRFLEEREGKSGLYPEKSEWYVSTSAHDTDWVIINDQIAEFFLTGVTQSDLFNDLILRPKYPKPCDLRLINLLLFYGADPNIKNCAELTPLHLAASSHSIANNRDHKAIIDCFLRAGADPNMQNIWRETPLHLALSNHDNRCVIKLLLKFGGNPSIKNSDGKTSFDIARDKCFNDFKNLVQIYSQT